MLGSCASATTLDDLVDQTIQQKLAQYPKGTMYVETIEVQDAMGVKSTIKVIRCKSMTQAKGCL